MNCTFCLNGFAGFTPKVGTHLLPVQSETSPKTSFMLQIIVVHNGATYPKSLLTSYLIRGVKEFRANPTSQPANI